MLSTVGYKEGQAGTAWCDPGDATFFRAAFPAGIA